MMHAESCSDCQGMLSDTEAQVAGVTDKAYTHAQSASAVQQHLTASRPAQDQQPQMASVVTRLLAEPFANQPLLAPEADQAAFQEIQHSALEQPLRQSMHTSQQTQTTQQGDPGVSQAVQTVPCLATTQQTQTGHNKLQSRHSQASVQACQACSQTDAALPLPVTSQHTQCIVPVQTVCSQTNSFSLHTVSQHTQAGTSTAEASCQASCSGEVQHTSTQTPAAASTADAGCQASNHASLLSVSTQHQVQTADGCSQTLDQDEQHSQTQARLQELHDELAGAQLKVQSLQSIVTLQEQQLQTAAGYPSASAQVGMCCTRVQVAMHFCRVCQAP